MASAQQLEKLYNIQRYFQREVDSLEGLVASERIGQIILKTEQILRQKTFLREERRNLRLTTEKIAERNAALVKMRIRSDWLPTSIADTAMDQRLILSISGMIFEIPFSVASKDPNSLLCELTKPNPPISPDIDGSYHFNRDWWLFRYILMFLRDGILPEDRVLLAQLYREGSFWNLMELQHAIEVEKLHLRTPTAKAEDKKWWEKLPNWLTAIDEKPPAPPPPAPPPTDWWKDTSYQGKTYLPLSSDPDKVVTKTGEKDEVKTPQITWGIRTKGKYDL